MRYLKYIIVAFLINQINFAQSNSIYTRYGIGDLFYSNSARYFGMGEGGNALFEKNSLSYSNPASWTSLELTRLDIGLYFSGSYQKSDELKSFSGATQFSGFLIGFPLKVNNGLSLVTGIVPFSRVNYSVKRFVPDEDFEHTAEFKGDGGVSKAFIGASYKLPLDFSIGSSFDYYVGNLNYYSNLDFSTSIFTDTKFRKSEKISGIGATVGIITPDIIGAISENRKTELRLSASFNYIGELLADSSILATTSLGEQTFSSNKTDIYIPSRLNLGASFSINNEHKFIIDYMTQQFSEFKFSGAKSDNLIDLARYSFGYEYKKAKPSMNSFWEQLALRGGLSYEQSQYSIYNNEINEIGFYGGLSFPLDNFNSIDIGFKYAKRGILDNNLVEENIFKMLVSLSIGELWFIR